MSARGWLLAYLVVGVLHLICIAIGAQAATHVTKVVLIPLLFVAVGAMSRSLHVQALPWLLVGLVFAWLGDVALIPDGQLWFVAGMLFFLIMQLCYIRGYFLLGAASGLRRRRWALVVFPLFWLVANVVLWPSLGDLRIPIAIYSIALVTMAMVGVGAGPLFGIGGTIFMLSDLMIGVGAAFGSSTLLSFLIMLTYIVAQLLIVVAWTTDRTDPKR